MRPINYDGKGNVMAYHAIRNRDGSTTEHAAIVPLSGLTNATRPDGTTNPHVLVMTCPTCGASAYVPLTGDRDAQRLHAMTRVARGVAAQYNPVATQSVINDVRALGGVPFITPNDNPMSSR
jgi:hypothetical protein